MLNKQCYIVVVAVGDDEVTVVVADDDEVIDIDEGVDDQVVGTKSDASTSTF